MTTKKKPAAKKAPAKKSAKGKVTVEANGKGPVDLYSPEGTEIVGEVIQGAVDATKPEEPEEDLQTRFDKLQKRLARIEGSEKRVEKLQAAVAIADQAVKSAQANHKAKIAERDKSVREMQRIISDSRAGQDPLPGMDLDEQDADEPPSTSDNWPISELGSKQLVKLIGDKEFRGDPIGLTAAQLDKLEGADIATIADLEKFMVEKLNWWEILAKRQDANIVQRVVDSLNAFRSKYPQPERPPTILESLKEQNDAVLQPASVDHDAQKILDSAAATA